MSSPISSAAETPATKQQFDIQTVWLALRCWWKIAVPAAILLAAAAGAATFLLHRPVYTADSWLLIDEKEFVLTRDVRADSRRFIQNQFEFIRSPKLIGPLIGMPAIAATPELAKAQEPVLELAKRIIIKPRGNSDIYVVSFSSESPQKAELVVKEVVDAYLAFNTRLESEQDERIIRLLEEQRVARYEEMNQLREVVRTLSIDLTGVDPFRSNAAGKEGNTANPLASLQDDLVTIEVEQEILAHRIKFEEERQAAESVEPPAAEIAAVVESHQAFANLQARIHALRKKEADFQRVGKNLANNLAYNQLRSELKVLNDEVGPLRSSLENEIKETMSRNLAKNRGQLLAEMRKQYEVGNSRLNVLKAKFDKGMGAAKEFAGTTLELEFRKSKLEQVTKIHEQISARVLAIKTEQRAPSRVRLFKEPTVPVLPDELVPFKKIAMFGGVAFLVPLALAVGWEHLLRRVNSRDQLETNQISVIAEVASLPTRMRSSELGRKSANRDVLLFEESVDSLRTYLSLVESLQGLRVLAVTSAVSGEGKTSLAAQLAVSIARATGEPTLLIDGDMRSPDIHAIFDIDKCPGLAEVLSGECPVEEAIETNFNEKLHILTSGQLRTSPHRLLSNGEFGLLLNRLSETYRHIIVDTPPILPASESLVLARSADAAVLCMRRDHSRMRQAQEATVRMAAAGVKSIGAVLVGIPLSQYAYKYGRYLYDATPEQSN